MRPGPPRVSSPGAGRVEGAGQVEDVAPAPAAEGRRTRPRPLRVYLIGCGSRKVDHPAPAPELYTSDLLRKELAYVRERADVIYVVSAPHALVPLDRVLVPYSRSPHRAPS